jgi:hypothetical protein
MEIEKSSPAWVHSSPGIDTARAASAENPARRLTAESLAEFSPAATARRFTIRSTSVGASRSRAVEHLGVGRRGKPRERPGDVVRPRLADRIQESVRERRQQRDVGTSLDPGYEGGLGEPLVGSRRIVGATPTLSFPSSRSAAVSSAKASLTRAWPSGRSSTPGRSVGAMQLWVVRATMGAWSLAAASPTSRPVASGATLRGGAVRHP